MSDMAQYIKLPVGQTILIDVSRQFRSDLRRKASFSRCQGANGVNELMAQGTFQKIAARPRLDRLQRPDIASVRRQYRDASLRKLRHDGADGADAIELRHLHIHEGDIGLHRSV